MDSSISDFLSIVYLIFCIWDLFEVIVIYFTVVETKGLTLEEIEEVFSQDDPVKYSIEHNFKAKPEASPSHA